MSSHPPDPTPGRDQLLPRVLAVAALVLGLLVLVALAGRWFEVRPASGSAGAMSRAAEKPVGS